MNILVTNDDGDSEGLRMLLEVAKRIGDASAIAPNRQRSAVSGALTLHKPLRLHRHGGDVFSINGTPSDCVLFGIHSGEFGKPDMVLSGINWGDNSGSGDWRHPGSWGDRGSIVEVVAGIVSDLRPRLRPDTFFNVNMPFSPKGAKVVHVGMMQRERYGTRIERREDPEGKPYFWIIGSPLEPVEGTDVYEVMVKGNIAITEVSLSCFRER
jgi:5'-nucleotidase